MPFSGNDFVIETKKYINKNHKNARIIDIGAGAGKFGTQLYNFIIDAIEVHKPYIKEFNLSRIYRNVFNVNCLGFGAFGNYDLAIMWKTLEHLTIEEARKLINEIKESGIDFIFSVPFELKQGVCHNNTFEIHKQDDLTPEIVKKRYPEFDILFESDHHGVYKLVK